MHGTFMWSHLNPARLLSMSVKKIHPNLSTLGGSFLKISWEITRRVFMDVGRWFTNLFVSMAKATREKMVLVLVVLSLISVCSAATPLERRKLTDLEIRKELKRLNKPAIKSMKSEDGDIIDCVDIYKQPAFDHPLLKNHTIQMRPSFYDGKKMSSFEPPLEQLWHKSGSCPEGTIPIRRTRKEDLLRAISSKGLEASTSSRLEHAKMVMEGENHGAEAKINAWNVHVESYESSTASVYVRKKDTSEFVNSGWIISQNIMGDNKTRFYGRWEADGDGCYNLVCPGFVQISHKVGFGQFLTPLSTYDGEQRTISLRISMDPADGHWWLVVSGESLGYWPSSLFKNMVVSADLIEWSGEVENTNPWNQHTSTQMGSGHFSNEGFKKAAFFDDCVYLVNHDDARKPSNAIVSATNPKCYDVSETSKGRDRGLFFYYGGPGGPSCDK